MPIRKSLPRLFAALAVASAVGGACGGPAPPNVDCTMVAVVPKYSELTIWPTCTVCHNSFLTGAARRSAPGGVDYDTYELAKAHAMSGAAQVNAGKMPPGGYTQPTEEQKTAFYQWAMCGTPN